MLRIAGRKSFHAARIRAGRQTRLLDEQSPCPSLLAQDARSPAPLQPGPNGNLNLPGEQQSLRHAYRHESGRGLEEEEQPLQVPQVIGAVAYLYSSPGSMRSSAKISPDFSSILGQFADPSV